MLTPIPGVRYGHRTINFNATTSAYNYGALNAAHNTNLPATWLALIRPTGASENNFGYIASKVIANSATGMRWTIEHNAGAPRMTFALTSGAAGPAQTAPSGLITYGRWVWMAATYAGGLAAASIKLYHGSRSLTEAGSYPTPVDGSGSLDASSSYVFQIGNRDGGDRTFAGDMAIMARWHGALTQEELNHAIKAGPLAVQRHSLLFCWAGGADVGPQKLRATSVTAKALGRPYKYPLEQFRPPPWFSDVGGAGSQSISPGGIGSLEAFGAASVIPGGVNVSPAAIDSLEAFGSTTVAQGGVSIICSGIASLEAFGSLSVVPGAVSIVCSGIATAEAFGDAVVSAGGSVISATGIASQEAFGAHTIVPGGVTVTCSGIVSSEDFGALIVAVGAQYVVPGAIASAEAFGSHVLSVGGVTIVCSGVASAEAFGTAIVIGGAVTIYTPGATWYVHESRTLAVQERRTWTRH